MPANQFDQLDAQSDVSRFAQMTTEEHSEFQSWLDWRNSQMDQIGLFMLPHEEILECEIPDCPMCGHEHYACECNLPEETYSYSPFEDPIEYHESFA